MAGSGQPADIRCQEGRLAQLEEQMNIVLDQSRSAPNRLSETPRSTSARPFAAEDRQITGLIAPTPKHAMPQVNLINEMIEVYFQFCHMQPLWLFERSDLASSDQHVNEITLPLMALAFPYSLNTKYQGRTEELSRQYSKLGREHILLQVTQGNVKISTMQGLCMLAFANFIGKVRDVHFALLHISMAMTFLKCAGMDTEPQADEISPATEARRKVFWSLLYLDQIYGQQSTPMNVLSNFQSPKYVGIQLDLHQEYSQQPPSWPLETSTTGQSHNGGVWAYSVQLSALWKQVRTYMSQCADGTTRTPWSADSGYSIICAHLMDLETRLPAQHRWDLARFSDRTTEELQSNRSYWSPWLMMQFTYHTIHSLLNHPFLYSSRPQQLAQLAVPNTFWKTSSELALIHSTWVVRLVEVVTEKSYQISDPFLGHCVAISATILIYFCRAADVRLKQAAQSKLAICKSYLRELSVQWPVCKTMHDRLQALMKSAFANPQESDPYSPRRTVSINIGLMWEILDYTNVDTRRNHARGGLLLHESLYPAPTDTDDEEETVETQFFHNSTREVDTSDGGQAMPPFSDHITRRSTRTNARRDQDRPDKQTEWMLPDPAATLPPTSTAPEGPSEPLAGPQQTLPYAPWPGIFAGNASIMDITHDPFVQFQDPGSPYLSIWEVGNL